MVYVLNKNGQPLMPTKRYGKVRRLLKSGKAKVIKRCPFTIQLQYDTTNYTQSVSLGIDAGSKHIGVSATTTKEVLYEADVTLRNDIVNLLSTRSVTSASYNTSFVVVARPICCWSCGKRRARSLRKRLQMSI